jgi:hypothetical protein
VSDTAIISAVSPMVSGLIVALLFWGWRKFVQRIDENRELTLGMKADFKALSDKVVLHQGEDSTMFNAQGERIARTEGAIDVLKAIAAGKKVELP